MTSEATMVSDELVRAATAGERDAVEHLLAEIRPQVVRYCRSRLGPPNRSPSADDVAQEVCLAVLAALPRYRAGRPARLCASRRRAGRSCTTTPSARWRCSPGYPTKHGGRGWQPGARPSPCARRRRRRTPGTADLLHLHHSSVARRLEQIGKNLGIDLGDSTGLLRARLALTACGCSTT